MAERARIVLLAVGGLTGPQIAGRAGCTEPTVIKWRRQYAEDGLAGLEDAPRPGGPKTALTDDAVCEILAATVTPPPQPLQAQGVTHWPARRLADWLHRPRKCTVSRRHASFGIAVLYGAVHGQGGTGASGTEAGRVDRNQAVGFAPGAGQRGSAAHLGLP